MLAPRDPSDPDRKRHVRDAALYGVVVGLAVFLLLLIVIDAAWVLTLLIGIVAGVAAAVFFLWSATDGFVRFSDDAAKRISERTGRPLPGGESHVGSGDPGGIDPGTPIAGDADHGESAKEAAAAFDGDMDQSKSDHLGAGDPGGVDAGMPMPDDARHGDSARDAAATFEGVERRDASVEDHEGAGDPGGIDAGMPAASGDAASGEAKSAARPFEGEPDTPDTETGARSGFLDRHAGAGDPGAVDPAMPDPAATEAAESAETAGEPFEAEGNGGVETESVGRRPELLDSPDGESGDDLKHIRGVGPKLEAMLNDLGVWHFRQIASWGPEEVAWVDGHLEGFNGRVSRDEWVSQAKVLAGGGETDFSERASRGDVY